MSGRIVLGILLVVVLIVGIVGAGGYAYNLGLAQGLASGGKLDVPTTGVAPYPYFGMPFMYRPFGFGWSFLGCLIPLFFFCMFFGLLRAFVRGPRWGWRMHQRHWDGGVPPMAEEWHRKMHEQQPQPTPKM